MEGVMESATKGRARPESQIDVLCGPQASEQETGAGKQNNRQCKFRHYQGAAQTKRGRSAGDTLPPSWPDV